MQNDPKEDKNHNKMMTIMSLLHPHTTSSSFFQELPSYKERLEVTFYDGELLLSFSNSPSSMEKVL